VSGNGEDYNSNGHPLVLVILCYIYLVCLFFQMKVNLEILLQSNFFLETSTKIVISLI
jgi:hypothetical protein